MYEEAIGILEEALGTPIEDPDSLRNLAIETLQRLGNAEAALKNSYAALDGIYIEEINGRLCALPESLPSDLFGSGGDEYVPREARCCEACRKHWDRLRSSLKEIEALIPTVKGARGVYADYADGVSS